IDLSAFDAPAEQPKPKAPPSLEGISKKDIRKAALARWQLLDEVIHDELKAVKDGGRELNAALVTSVVRHVEASFALSQTPEPISPKDEYEANAAKNDKQRSFELPVFDDEPDENGYVNSAPINTDTAKSQSAARGLSLRGSHSDDNN